MYEEEWRREVGKMRGEARSSREAYFIDISSCPRSSLGAIRHRHRGMGRADGVAWCSGCHCCNEGGFVKLASSGRCGG